MRGRLLREAKAMARLSHPEVITVYDVGAFGEQLFVAMEYVDGGTLRHWRRAEPRTWAAILAVYERAGQGLCAAHEAGLIHRDFKPDNVLVGKDGRVRVTDFGLARSVDRADVAAMTAADIESSDLTMTLTRTGALLGTPAYMAPEQLRGATADARSDVFSFCVALYESLYEERPFSARTVPELRAAIDEGALRSAPANARVPTWVRTLLLRGMRAAPEERFESMRLQVPLGKHGWPMAPAAAPSVPPSVVTAIGLSPTHARAAARAARPRIRTHDRVGTRVVKLDMRLLD